MSEQDLGRHPEQEQTDRGTDRGSMSVFGGGEAVLNDARGYSISLFSQHAEMLAASGISAARASRRGYVSVDTKRRLSDLNIAVAGQKVPGLLIPQLRADGSRWGYQYRPDVPRKRGGKPVKYETPVDQRNGLDVPPGVGAALGDPSVTLWITEGVKKADSACERGLCCVSLPGVWSWRGTNEHRGKTAIADWNDVALNDRRVVLAFDSDVARKSAVRGALTALASYLSGKGAQVEYAHLPDDGDGKTGLDDYLINHGVEELNRLVRPDPPPLSAAQPDEEANVAVPRIVAVHEPVSLPEAHEVFRRWFGAEYDLNALDIVLSVAAGQHLTGDPAWLLMVSGSGAAKTETVLPLEAAGALVTSTITSEGALLSGTSSHERTTEATGGLLRKLGDNGLLVIKDVTSILSMSKEPRASVLAGLREVYDGKWERNVGTDGGKSLTWNGRIVAIGAVTTAWDSHHAVVAAMGDRFLLVRIDSTTGRKAAAMQAISNSGREIEMRAALNRAVAGVLSQADASAADLDLTETESATIYGLADVITRTRTGVETDYRGDVKYAHALEMPTRMAKQLTCLFRGALAVGIDRQAALGLVIRAGRDTMPPDRLAILLKVAAHPGSVLGEIARMLNRPATTVKQTMQALVALDLVASREADEPFGKAGTRPVTRFSITGSDHSDALDLMRDHVSNALKRPEQGGAGNVTRPVSTVSKSEAHLTDPYCGDPADFSRTTETCVELESLRTCPVCGTPTIPSAAGHRSLCLPCTQDEISSTPEYLLAS